MADDKDDEPIDHSHLINEAGREIAHGIATTPDAAPATEEHASPWEMKMSPGEMKRLLEENEAAARKDAAARRKAQHDTEQQYEHRLQHGAVGGYDSSEIPDRKAFMEMESTPIQPVNPVFYRKGDHPNAVTLAEREQFLTNYVKCGVWNHSAYLLGRSGRTFRELSKIDPIFAIQVGEAVQDWREQLQGEVIRRGRFGTVEPIFAGKDGDLVGYKRTYSDMLLKMEIEAAWPSRYRTTQAPQIDDVVMRNQGVMVVPGVASNAEEYNRELQNRPKLDGNGQLRKTTRPVNRISKPTPSDN